MKTVLWICVFLIIWCTVHGQNCPSSCNQGCNTTTLECYCQHCHPQNAECNNVTGVCKYGCDYGYYGNQCMGRCSRAILNCGHCSQNGTVTCTACVTSGYSQYNGGCCSNQCGFDANGLVPCDTVTGKCSNGCKIGYYGAWCNNSCKEIRVNCGVCTITNNIPTCTRCASLYGERNVNGTIKCCQDSCQDCDNNKCYVCSAGYYPSDIAPPTCLPCPTHCARNGTICDSKTGKCLFGCVSGYFGDRCTEQCTIPNCRTCNYINSLFSCAECGSGYYITGSDCQLCNVRCQLRTCLQTGYCSNGCHQGYYGDMCQNQCMFIGCVTCNRQTGVCDRCDPGYYGFSCNNTCPTNCAVGLNATKATCVVDTGFCDFGCKDYSYGDQCNLACTNCYNGQCNRNTGVCTDPSGCKAYWYGEMCDQSCSNCLGGHCNRTSGFCGLGCNPGYYSERCLAVCPVNCAGVGGVVRCNFTTGSCLYGCNDGYNGDNCTIGCEHTNCISANCSRINGYCDACLAGFFGNNCQYKCSSYCAGNGACNQINGTCVDKCKPGITGYMCNVTCTETCIDGTCDFLTGRCEACYQTQPSIQCRTAECSTGFQGIICDKLCPTNCGSNKCNRYDETCTQGCKLGFYGTYCNNTCRCLAGDCDWKTGKCNCSQGIYGEICDKSCPQTCNNLNCAQMTGYCLDGCVTKFYGFKCELACSYCLNGLFDQNDGICTLQICLDGFFGSKCNKQCRSTCRTCDFATGDCISCKKEYYGTQCEMSCNRNCVVSNSTNICQKSSGKCSDGCLNKWYGDPCNQSCANCGGSGQCAQDSGICKLGCQPGWFTNVCKTTCPLHCANNTNNIVLCNIENGYCVSGCVSGFYGDQCQNGCRPKCFGVGDPCIRTDGTCLQQCDVGFYGSYCQFECSTNCISKECEFNTANCTRGCRTGFYGATCNSVCSSTCLDGTCDRYRGFCAACADAYPSPDCPDAECDPRKWGAQCEQTCPSLRCKNSKCLRSNGTCYNGCDGAYFGIYCTEQCRCVNGTCDWRDGTCSCSLGRYGTICDGICSQGCKDTACDQMTAGCLFGCKSGYYGISCNRTCDKCLNTQCDGGTGNCISGCVDGYYGQQCQTQCPSNCVRCDRTTGKCATCNAGYYGDTCQIQCSPYCMTDSSGVITCTHSVGECTSGCKAYWYGPACNQSCKNCKSGVCNRQTGQCNACEAGYYNTLCNLQCWENCKTQNGLKLCDFTTGYCIVGCNTGWYGNFCEKECSTRCKNKNCIASVDTCLEGCTQGYYGIRCEKTCNFNCDNGSCNAVTGKCSKCKVGFYGDNCDLVCVYKCRDGTCDQSSGRCPACNTNPIDTNCPDSDCPDGTYGSNCQLTCSSHCSSIKCTKENGTCAGGCKTGYFGAKCEGVCQCINNGQCNSNTGSCLCLSGYYGDKCEISCSSCELNSCDITGTCIIGCVDSYYGTRCTQKCDAICAACSRSDGSCTKCKPGEFGYRCDFKCSSQCRPASTGLVTCSKATGQCDNGCIDGWYGSNCDKICPNCLSGKCDTNTGMCLLEGCNAGWWSSYCSEACSGHCAGEINPVSCNTKTGVCDKGCVTGWYGSKCQSKCSSTCRNNNCIDNGYCIDGCVAGFYGDSCQYTCSLRCKDKTCDKNSGNCPSCEAGYYGTMCENGCVQTCLTTGTCEQVGTLAGRCRCANVGDCDCADGTYGSNCQFTCSLRCKDKACDKNSGNCPSCEAGYYGTMCENGCVQTCLTTGTCEQVGTLAGRCRCANVGDCENVISTLFAILFGVVLGVSVFLVTILSICLHKQRMLATDLKQQLQTRNNTYDGLNMRLTTPEPYAALTVERSDDSHQSAYPNPYEGLHRTLESSEPYERLEIRI